PEVKLAAELLSALRESVLLREEVELPEVFVLIASADAVSVFRVEAEDVRARTVRHTNSCYFTMVAIDDKGKPTTVPPLIIKDKMQQCRADAALERKSLRMESSHRPSCDLENMIGELTYDNEEHSK
ncbi:MAG: hypothetical protein ABS880_08880, partial [Psychrobacter alimentarius]